MSSRGPGTDSARPSVRLGIRCPTAACANSPELARRWHGGCHVNAPEGGTSKRSGEAAGYKSGLGGTAGGPVEGTSPSHLTAHRPLQPPSLDEQTIRLGQVGSRRRERKHTRSPHLRRVTHPLRASGHRPRSWSAGHWGMSRSITAETGRCPAVSPGVAPRSHLRPERTTSSRPADPARAAQPFLPVAAQEFASSDPAVRLAGCRGTAVAL